MMNDKANKVGCAQVKCSQFHTEETPGPAFNSYYVTMCTFDQATPTEDPYTPSIYGFYGCYFPALRKSTCTDPVKSQCYSYWSNPQYSMCCK